MILVTPTYNRFQECIELIKSADQQSIKPTQIIVLDNSGEGRFSEYLKQQETITDIPIDVIVSNINLGCARGWNLLLQVAYECNPEEWVLVANDDIKLHPEAIEYFLKEVGKHKDPIYCAGGIASPNAFSLFVTRYDILKDSVGLFDEMFLYPYCEDGDMYVRLKLAGFDLVRVSGVSADHIGSATLKAYSEVETELHHIRFKRNAEYFMLKWGIDHNSIHHGKPYAEPFNGENGRLLTHSYIKNMYGA